MTKQALDALRWYASDGKDGVEPTYSVMRALIVVKLVSPAGVITVAGREILKKEPAK